MITAPGTSANASLQVVDQRIGVLDGRRLVVPEEPDLENIDKKWISSNAEYVHAPKLDGVPRNVCGKASHANCESIPLGEDFKRN
ncbi:MAG: hypothetical protein KIS68_06760 [Bauldia sp.]|nr:hypothetical protein [Bauldia sp.]